MSVKILIGDVRAMLKTLPDESVHCVVTSPPYYGLRDYQTAAWEGGDASCNHAHVRDSSGLKDVSARQSGHAKKSERLTRELCRCGATRVDLQIGLESSPREFIETMVDVFREVKRVLRKDGTCWVNMGDSYAGSWGAQGRPNGENGQMANRSVTSARQIEAHPKLEGRTGTIGADWGMKPKDKMLMPHRLAIALCDDGWWVRDDIVWAKPNPMPESVRDRCTKAHEYIFLLAKGPKYYFDADAIAEESTFNSVDWNEDGTPKRESHKRGEFGGKNVEPGKEAFRTIAPTRNKRSVWTIVSQPFPEAHFATFPPELPEICIKAGCPAGGTVLDPFGGAGTTGLVADRLQRNAILIELNPVYAEMARKRIYGDAPLFAEVA